MLEGALKFDTQEAADKRLSQANWDEWPDAKVKETPCGKFVIQATDKETGATLTLSAERFMEPL